MGGISCQYIASFPYSQSIGKFDSEEGETADLCHPTKLQSLSTSESFYLR